MVSAAITQHKMSCHSSYYYNSLKETGGSLDLDKAYDMVKKNRVIHILSNLSIDGNILKFLHNFLSGQTI